jgi:hypothetical protein
MQRFLFIIFLPIRATLNPIVASSDQLLAASNDGLSDQLLAASNADLVSSGQTNPIDLNTLDSQAYGLSLQNREAARPSAAFYEFGYNVDEAYNSLNFGATQKQDG